MLTIRLQRAGTKNRPAFRIVLAEKARSASKKFHEILGHYNPRSKDFGIKDPERLKYWIAQHVQISPTVHNLFIEKKLMEGTKVKAWAPKKSVEAGSGSAGKEGGEAPAAAVAAPAEEAKAAAPSEDGASLAPEGREAPADETPKAEEPASEAPTETPQA